MSRLAYMIPTSIEGRGRWLTRKLHSLYPHGLAHNPFDPLATRQAYWRRTPRELKPLIRHHLKFRAFDMKGR